MPMNRQTLPAYRCPFYTSPTPLLQGQIFATLMNEQDNNLPPTTSQKQHQYVQKAILPPNSGPAGLGYEFILLD